MKIIIAGSRNFPKELWPLIFGLVASSGFDITEIVSGGAVGADQFGEYYAHESELRAPHPKGWGLPVPLITPERVLLRWRLFNRSNGWCCAEVGESA